MPWCLWIWYSKNCYLLLCATLVFFYTYSLFLLNVFATNSNLAVNWKKLKFTFKLVLSLSLLLFCVYYRRFTPVNFVHSNFIHSAVGLSTLSNSNGITRVKIVILCKRFFLLLALMCVHVSVQHTHAFYKFHNFFPFVCWPISKYLSSKTEKKKLSLWEKNQ